MKVCYVDETGTDGISPVLVMVGVIADGQRLPKTQSELAAIFGSLGNLSAKTLRELKSTQLSRVLDQAWRRWCRAPSSHREAM